LKEDGGCTAVCKGSEERVTEFSRQRVAKGMKHKAQERKKEAGKESARKVMCVGE
jgi:hypothetical protein